MVDEHARDPGSSSVLLVDFRVYVFELVMGSIVKSLESRFIQHRQL